MKKLANVRLTKKGGEGVFREFVELLLKADLDFTDFDRIDRQ